MLYALSRRLSAAFAPPQYLEPALAGIDLSTSGTKAVRISNGPHGLTLASYAEASFPDGALTNGEIIDRASVIKGLKSVATATKISAARVALSESKSYLFEASVPGVEKEQWITAVEQRLDELVPLPPQLTAFDVIKVGEKDTKEALVVGIGFARRIIDETLSVFDEAGVRVQALEGENFAMARALLSVGDKSTVLIIDIGKSTTKVCIVSKCVPRFATTINIGGNELTLAVQKYFGVTEAEARRVKTEKGIVPSLGNEEYIAAMLSTVSAIRDEISTRFEYWQSKAAAGSAQEPITQVILIGGNASIRGLTEYLESALRIPVVTGDVFTNFASREKWLPSIEYSESLSYATAIGLALYDLHAP